MRAIRLKPFLQMPQISALIGEDARDGSVRWHPSLKRVKNWTPIYMVLSLGEGYINGERSSKWLPAQRLSSRKPKLTQH
jgi:hypothetical protein